MTMMTVTMAIEAYDGDNDGGNGDDETADEDDNGCDDFSHWQASDQTAVHPLYKLFPDPEKVTTHWKPLLAEFYRRVFATPLFFTQIKGGNWLRHQDSILITSPCEDADRATEDAIVQAFQACQANIVCLPPHVMQGLQTAAAALTAEENKDAVEGDAARPDGITMACPQSLASTLKTHTEWMESLSPSHKHLILLYLCRHGDGSLLENLKLLPLADGTFCTCSDVEVHVCRDEQDLSLFPGLHHQLCYVSQPPGLLKMLRSLAHQGDANSFLLLVCPSAGKLWGFFFLFFFSTASVA